MEQMEVVRDLGATGSTNILRLKGPLTLSTLFLLQDTLREIPNVDTVIDVSEVPYIDSAGLGTILSRWSHTQRTSAASIRCLTLSASTRPKASRCLLRAST